MAFSYILEMTGKNETSRSFETFCASPFLNIGTIVGILKIAGNNPVTNGELTKWTNAFNKSFLQILTLLKGCHLVQMTAYVLKNL